MSLTLQPVQIATGSDDVEGQLVFADSSLVAVLVQLSDQHDYDAGKWFLEAGFGPIDPILPPLFADLEEAKTWIVEQLPSGS
ncbi:hypothetical protein CIW48_22835 [Methylobacterium sp. P1-11]|uniref:hypothetical protein n=1 Tax=Methylobacterium sp. P1-11 TaxID=2024616 RepID=UPI0011EF4561|nr:hypothetical protein [Methylobacterium sp. P1-11]KAA0121634.1 hypothetical protein CIW48_22835 [Methylobacterium sp. P1-11]